MTSDERRQQEVVDAYAELASIIEHSARYQAGGPRAEIARREHARLVELVAEMEDDADDCRDRILSAGYTPEQYEAWMTREASK